MLSADHVRARRRKGALVLSRVDADTRRRAMELAEAFAECAAKHVGGTRGELTVALDDVGVPVRDRKLGAGLRKLVDDRCEFEAESDLDPVEVRAQVFLRAAEARRDATEEAGFDATGVLTAVARSLDVSTEELERALYADLREQHVLRDFIPQPPERMVADWELAQAQAVLLRATRVTAVVHASSPAVYRSLFRKLKFRRLLYAIHPTDEGGYRIEIDGPMSLFTSSTKYGLALALVLPFVRACDRWSIDAEVLWGKRRERLDFNLEGRAIEASGRPEGASPVAHLSDDVQALFERFGKLDSPWEVSPADDVLSLPGEGLCIPDLRFVHGTTGEVAFLEVMGFWSRDAVWRRVELVRAGLTENVIFAVSTRLRVSEAVLGEDLPGALHVYKGVISAKRVAEQLDALVAREG